MEFTHVQSHCPHHHHRHLRRRHYLAQCHFHHHLEALSHRSGYRRLYFHYPEYHYHHRRFVPRKEFRFVLESRTLNEIHLNDTNLFFLLRVFINGSRIIIRFIWVFIVIILSRKMYIIVIKTNRFGSSNGLTNFNPING